MVSERSIETTASAEGSFFKGVNAPERSDALVVMAPLELLVHPMTRIVLAQQASSLLPRVAHHCPLTDTLPFKRGLFHQSNIERGTSRSADMSQCLISIILAIQGYGSTIDDSLIHFLWMNTQSHKEARMNLTQ